MSVAGRILALMEKEGPLKTFALILDLALFGPILALFLEDHLAASWGLPSADALARSWKEGLGVAFLGVLISRVGLGTLRGGGVARQGILDACLALLVVLGAHHFDILPDLADEPRTLLLVLAVTVVNWVVLRSSGWLMRMNIFKCINTAVGSIALLVITRFFYC